MKISYKLILGYLLVALIASSATYFTLKSYKNIDAAFERLMNDPIPTIKALNDLKYDGNRIIASAHEVELTSSESTSPENSANEPLTESELQLVASGRKYNESLKIYENLINSQGDFEKKSLQIITKSRNDLLDTSMRIIAMKKQGIVNEEFLEEKKKFEEEEKFYFKSIDNSLSHEYEQLSGEQDFVEATISESTRKTLIAAFLSLVLAIALGIYVSRSIAKRITKLKTASEKVGHGELETNIIVEGNDEIAALTQSFNKMIGDLQESHIKLVSSKNFVNNIVSSIADSLIVLDMDLKIIRVNQAVLNLTKFSSEELIGHSIKTLRRDGGFFNDRDVEELHTKNYVSGVESFWLTKDNREVPILFSASIMHDSEEIDNGIVCVAQDLTVRKSLENQLSHQALHDSLTKLANRILFGNRVEHALARADRKHNPIAVLFLDLDNFKAVNDTLGHEAGDILLISVAERLIASLRPSDTVARLGGDEFAVLLEDISNIEEVEMIAERLNDVLRSSFSIGGKKLYVHTSIGIAINFARNESIEDLLRNADLAMYKAKNQGKDRFVIFENKMREDLIERVEFEAELRRAIELKEFVLHYQPIINLESEQMIGMEALVRWNHPQHGLIPPDKFIPVAEETGLIIPLGQWVLEEACQQARKWQTEFDDGQNLSITVNLSNKQAQEGNLVQQVAYALAKSNLPAHSLILEITESTMLQDTEATINKLTELKQLGVRIAIDDFGTGYSSLSYLQRFPIDVLKIDKSFVDKINESKEGAAVARAIITMSETLHLKTIAEGIENNGQNVALQRLGCEFGQGFHFAKPLTKEAMSELLSKKSLNDETGFPVNQSGQDSVIDQNHKLVLT